MGRSSAGRTVSCSGWLMRTSRAAVAGNENVFSPVRSALKEGFGSGGFGTVFGGFVPRLCALPDQGRAAIDKTGVDLFKIGNGLLFVDGVLRLRAAAISDDGKVGALRAPRPTLEQ